MQAEAEIDFAIKKLKLNKAPWCDKILNEVLKTGKDIIKGHLLELFNRILSLGKYPMLWSFGLIVPIHEKDDQSKAENYRGITLLSKAEQGGFKKGRVQ